ncbi:hypothetical protein GBA52_004696 [Prunus armeniaca]|nr:hypothetical protein GBA52_004696 [Prunus armeniaca]
MNCCKIQKKRFKKEENGINLSCCGFLVLFFLVFVCRMGLKALKRRRQNAKAEKGLLLLEFCQICIQTQTVKCQTLVDLKTKTQSMILLTSLLKNLLLLSFGSEPRLLLAPFRTQKKP